MQRSTVSEEVDQLSLDRAVAQSSSGSTRNRTTNAEFDIPKSLRRPRDVSYSVQSLYEEMKGEILDLEVEYQRDVVWKTEKQMMLIDSVFTNHYMPPIILSVIYDKTTGAEVKKICLDGNNGLQASSYLWMVRFLVFKHPETLKNWWYKVDESTATSRAKNIIPDRVRVTFANKQVRCVEYEELDEEDEREIFRRVQLGMALSSAEKLRVLNTQRARFINELKVLFVTENSLAAPAFRWERSRGADYRCLAQAVYVISKWGTDNGASLKSAGTLPQVEKWLEEDSEPVPADFVALIKQTFTILVELTVNPAYSGLFRCTQRSVSPVEIIGVLVLVYAHFVIAPPSKKLTLPQLSVAVANMRQQVRREHKDIRLNDRVGKTIVTFVKAYTPPPTAPAVQAPRPSVPSIAELTSNRSMDVDAFPQQSHAIPSPPWSSNPGKRKREASGIEQRSPKRLTHSPSDGSSGPSASSSSGLHSFSTSARHYADPGLSSTPSQAVTYMTRNPQMPPESPDPNLLAHRHPVHRRLFLDVTFILIVAVKIEPESPIGMSPNGVERPTDIEPHDGPAS
ncbi:hypothetical protein BT96DRAFT_996824 [Gymnopus androsaceus JB14]|uniref:GmrSD restriction endonucleases N-terminal domain-containing protein n=1 Tax=Gymnopus androsaceus JB14 TaxID=1447944 RepID=A0A6A4HEQ1_9AGAR|nr:hypothetical protein BT96DRAFT_996824 [Gymnopus androsaceus JB14]